MHVTSVPWGRAWRYNTLVWGMCPCSTNLETIFLNTLYHANETTVCRGNPDLTLRLQDGLHSLSPSIWTALQQAIRDERLTCVVPHLPSPREHWLYAQPPFPSPSVHLV